MVNPQDFSTQTCFIPRKNAGTGKHWGIALDIGYSAVKGMSPNHVFCFPSFARVFNGQMLNVGEGSPDDIQYRDENGVIWNVGATAQNSLSSADTNDSVQSLYGRNRYFAPMFLVIARVGLALGLLHNDFGNPGDKSIFLQTGLPPAFLKSDAADLKEVLSGHHEFSVRIGNGAWKNFSFDLSEDNIKVMPQPMGSFFSAAFSNEGTQLPSAKKLFSSNLLIFDAGFGTVDIYSIRNRQIESSQSFDDCGMKAVLSETSEAIAKKFGVEVPVHAMQKSLREGFIQTRNRRTKTSTKERFDDLLEAASAKVCKNAIERVDSSYDSLFDYDYLLVTGGTGAAWQDIITEEYAGLTTLKVITGNQNDTLSHIFSNVRGYYLYQAGRLRRGAGDAE